MRLTFDHHRAPDVVRRDPRQGHETGSSSYESYTGSSSASYTDENALSADEDSDFGSDDIPASAYAGAAGAVTAGATVAEPTRASLITTARSSLIALNWTIRAPMTCRSFCRARRRRHPHREGLRGREI